MRTLIHRFKYGYQVRLRRPLGLLMAEEISLPGGSDLIIPVPLHVRRLRQRGFNQAVLLGEILAQEWQLPMERTTLQRVRWTEPQTTLPAAAREANVRGAFAVARPIGLAGRRVLLVDDVYTTGSTVSECARVLRHAGAAEVLVATVARTAI